MEDLKNIFINKIIHRFDIYKVEAGNGFKYRNPKWYPNNINNWHCGVDIIAKYKEMDNGISREQYDDIKIINPFKLAKTKINEKLEYGKYILLYEIDENKNLTGRGLYIGHLKDFAIFNNEIIPKEAMIGIMGSTGTLVYPKGFIHAHIELKNERGNAVQKIGDIELWS